MRTSLPAAPAELLEDPLLHSVLLPAGTPRRGMVPTPLPRSEKFIASYEYDVLFYDVFWDVAHENVVLLGPPPVDLQASYSAATYRAYPSSAPLKPKGHHSSLVHLISLHAPKDTTHVEITFAGVTQRVPVGANRAEFFRGSNLLFTLSKDNDLRWIADWARFHVVNQGVDAIMLFDNNSSRYELSDIRDTLLAVPGLKKIAVVPVPHPFPREDRAVPRHIFWAHFLQSAIIVDMFRRYGMLANGILNCDIDELAVPLADETVFDAANRSRSGTVYFRQCWVEPVPEKIKSDGQYRHRDFRQIAADADYRSGSTAKWALTPNRHWLRKLKMQPDNHAVANRPMLTRHKPGTAFIAHFKAISNSWKYDRPVSVQVDNALKQDAPLAQAMDRAFPLDAGENQAMARR